ncbi:1869_t:CDS:2 [Funneliformis mosseae]|uniref:1869_t:CDS:1 n=1 Tax=Funneliformis mosseae TaxID=27381 RepID=A0A9N9N843_FUNMO|nr:1869_t:CDS:2 [Funneliformis mosseae]
MGGSKPPGFVIGLASPEHVTGHVDFIDELFVRQAGTLRLTRMLLRQCDVSASWTLSLQLSKSWTLSLQLFRLNFSDVQKKNKNVANNENIGILFI